MWYAHTFTHAEEEISIYETTRLSEAFGVMQGQLGRQ